jgi:DNA-binding transcriptional MerR regulator
MSAGEGLRSGQVAAAAGVNVETLRYYERRGLLAEPGRSPGGHRMYPREAVTVLRVIKAAQRLGFTLDEVADLLDVGRHRHRSAPGRRARDAGLQERAQAKLVEVEASPICSPSATTCARLSTPAAGTCWSAPGTTAVSSRSRQSPLAARASRGRRDPCRRSRFGAGPWSLSGSAPAEYGKQG